MTDGEMMPDAGYLMPDEGSLHPAGSFVIRHSPFNLSLQDISLALRFRSRLNGRDE
jgi:hypothetical protein